MKLKHSPSSEPRCICGWPRTEELISNRGHCCVCHEPVMNADILNHLRVAHPEKYGNGPQRAVQPQQRAQPGRPTLDDWVAAVVAKRRAA